METIDNENTSGNKGVSKTDIVIYKTSDYPKFKFSALNRTPKHFNKIVESIKKGDFTPYNPILVTAMEDGNLLLIDGQNRFLACQKLGLPIHFVVCGEVTIEDAPTLNSASKNWPGIEYVEHFAKMGKEDYVKILEANKKYGAPLSGLIRLSSNQFSPMEHITAGTYRLMASRNPEELCKHWKEVTKYVPFAKSDLFFSTLGVCYYSGKYDPQRMINKLSICSGLMHQQPKRGLLRKEIEKVYNYHVKGSNVVIFDVK